MGRDHVVVTQTDVSPELRIVMNAARLESLIRKRGPEVNLGDCEYIRTSVKKLVDAAVKSKEWKTQNLSPYVYAFMLWLSRSKCWSKSSANWPKGSTSVLSYCVEIDVHEGLVTRSWRRWARMILRAGEGDRRRAAILASYATVVRPVVAPPTVVAPVVTPDTVHSAALVAPELARKLFE